MWRGRFGFGVPRKVPKVKEAGHVTVLLLNGGSGQGKILSSGSFKSYCSCALNIRKLNINLTKTVRLGGSIITFVVQINPGDI